jgi:transposase InsO family protein
MFILRKTGFVAHVKQGHKNIMTTDRLLELLHMDLFGPIAYISIGENKYCLVIVDDYSRFTWVFFLQEKSQAQETLKRFLRRAQNEFRLRIKKIRSDNGTDSRIHKLKDFLRRRASSMSSLLPTYLNKMV